MNLREPRHVPVMVDEVVTYLAPGRGGVFIDCTVGLGGHAEALLEAGGEARLIGIDRDPRALERCAERLAPFGDRVRLVRGCFGDLREVMASCGVAAAAGVLADLGVSSLQLDSPERGFSLRQDGPLDMRMGDQELTAADVVNQYEESELQRILHDYGEERMSRRIARAIADQRIDRPLETTGDLRRLVHDVKRRSREGRIDSATRVFQALRIEVNKEIVELERLLDEAVRILDVDGRLVVISYHSLEDRPVKRRLRLLSRGVADPVTGRPREETRLLEVLTKRAVRPREDEVEANPRARSARLRAARRLETP